MTEVAIDLEDEVFCDQCGATIKVKPEVVKKTGVKVASGRPVAPNGKTKTAAALLAFFLGGIGVHKYYLGDTEKGTMYSALRWTFIPVVMGVVEGIKLLKMSDEAFVEKYGSL